VDAYPERTARGNEGGAPRRVCPERSRYPGSSRPQAAVAVHGPSRQARALCFPEIGLGLMAQIVGRLAVWFHMILTEAVNTAWRQSPGFALHFARAPVVSGPMIYAIGLVWALRAANDPGRALRGF
jgi:hypothetical protein